MDGYRLLVISPVRNEAAHLERTARSLVAQERPPDAWVVVDDGSDDGTLELLRRLEREIDFLEVVAVPPQPPVPDRLARAAAPRAFLTGLESAPFHDFTHVAKLDGDIELPPEWYAELLARMGADPSLGIAGGDLIEPSGEDWQVLPIPRHHVHGAVKLYSRECYEAIGGVRECLGWDTIDETCARMGGYRTHSPTELVARHHRPHASADGTLRGRRRHGACAYIAHFPLWWVALRSLKVATSRPYGISGINFLAGYVNAALRRTPRVEDPGFRRQVRRELRARVVAGLHLERRPAT
jgi:glycosyltransferase involved in cell wall biosynthesis